MSGPRELSDAAIAGLKKLKEEIDDDILCQEIQHFLLEQKDSQVEDGFAAAVEKVADSSWQSRKSRCEAIGLSNEIVFDEKSDSGNDIAGVKQFKRHILDDLLAVSEEKKLKLARRIYFQRLIKNEFKEEDYFAEDANVLKEILLDGQLLKAAVESLAKDEKSSKDNSRKTTLKKLFDDVRAGEKESKRNKESEGNIELKVALKAFKSDYEPPKDVINRLFVENQLRRFKNSESYAALPPDKIQKLKDDLGHIKIKTAEQADSLFKGMLAEIKKQEEKEEAGYPSLLASGLGLRDDDDKRLVIDGQLDKYYSRSHLPPNVEQAHLIEWLTRKIKGRAFDDKQLEPFFENTRFLERIIFGIGSKEYEDELKKDSEPKGYFEFLRYFEFFKHGKLKEYAKIGRHFILAFLMAGYAGKEKGEEEEKEEKEEKKEEKQATSILSSIFSRFIGGQEEQEEKEMTQEEKDRADPFLSAGRKLKHAFAAHHKIGLHSGNFSVSKTGIYNYICSHELTAKANGNPIFEEKLATLRESLDEVLQIKWKDYQKYLTDKMQKKQYVIESKFNNRRLFNNVAFVFQSSELPTWMDRESLIKLLICNLELLKAIKNKPAYKIIMDRVFGGEGQYSLNTFDLITNSIIVEKANNPLNVVEEDEEAKAKLIKEESRAKEKIARREELVAIVAPYLFNFFSKFSILPEGIAQKSLINILIYHPDFFASMQNKAIYSAIEDRLFGKNRELAPGIFNDISKLIPDEDAARRNKAIAMVTPYLEQQKKIEADNAAVKASEAIAKKAAEEKASKEAKEAEIAKAEKLKVEEEEKAAKLLAQQLKEAEEKRAAEEKRKQEEVDRREREQRLAEELAKEEKRRIELEQQQREQAREAHQKAMSEASSHLQRIGNAISGANHNGVHHQFMLYASLFHPPANQPDPNRVMLPRGVKRKIIDINDNENLHDKVRESLNNPNIVSEPLDKKEGDILGNKGKVAINYVDDDPNSNTPNSAAGCYSEYFTPTDHQYRIAVQRMPATLDKANILQKAFQDLGYGDSKLDIWEGVTLDQLRKDTEFKIFMQQNFSNVPEDKYKQISETLIGKIRTAWEQDVPETNPSQWIPSTQYLDFVNKQIISFAAAVGLDKKIYIRPCKDKHLLLSYILICKAKNLNYVIEKSGFNFDINESRVNRVRELYAENKLEKISKVDLEGDDLANLKKLEKNITSPKEAKEVAQLVSKMQSGVELNNNERKRLKELKDEMPAPQPASLKPSSS